MKNLFDEAMSGIGEKVALQEIRKVLRGKGKDDEKLKSIVSIVETYSDYAARRDLDAEDRELKEEEAQLRRERDQEALEGMMDRLTIHKGDK